VAGLAVLVAGVAALSHSRLITSEEHPGLRNKVDGHVPVAGGRAAHDSKR